MSFVVNVGKQTTFAPEFRVEVMHIEVRPLGTFSNDTVYLTRFAAPLWIEDCTLTGLAEDRLKTGPWQMVEVHLSQVMELYQSLVEDYPHIQFPQIDPLTKEMNLITESKKNTKMF